MDNQNFVELSSDTCDSCGCKGPTALYHHRGTPVLAQCRRCDPRAWEAAGEYAREQWMSGVTPTGCSI
jgi:hypothetical protein